MMSLCPREEINSPPKISCLEMTGFMRGNGQIPAKKLLNSCEELGHFFTGNWVFPARKNSVSAIDQ